MTWINLPQSFYRTSLHKVFAWDYFSCQKIKVTVTINRKSFSAVFPTSNHIIPQLIGGGLLFISDTLFLLLRLYSIWTAIYMAFLFRTCTVSFKLNISRSDQNIVTKLHKCTVCEAKRKQPWITRTKYLVI